MVEAIPSGLLIDYRLAVGLVARAHRRAAMENLLASEPLDQVIPGASSRTFWDRSTSPGWTQRHHASHPLSRSRHGQSFTGSSS